MESEQKSSSLASHNAYYATLSASSRTKSLAVLALAFLLTAGSLSAADFFKNDVFSDLPKDKLYPQGQIFPITGYSPPSVEGMKELGFTATGPTYGKSQGKLAKASAREGLKNVWQLHVEYDGMLITGKPSLAKVAKAAGKKGIDWVKMGKCVENTVKKIVAEHGDTVAWWALGLEEVRWWNKNEMKYCQVAYDAIKRADPEKRPVWIYMPGHYGYGGMRSYMKFMDMLGQGYYPNFGNRVGYRYWCENVQKTVEGFEPERPMLAVTEMFREPKTEEDRSLISNFVRHDIWMAIIHKFKGIVIFSLANRGGFDSHGDYFFAYCENANLLTHKGLGNVALFGEDMKDLSLEITEGSQTVSIQRKQGKPAKQVTFTYPTLKWRDLRHNSGRYLFAASSSKEPVKATLKGLPAQKVQVIDMFTGKVLGTTDNGTFALEFGPWGVNLLKFVPAK